VLAGSAAGDYRITLRNAKGTITPAPLTVAADDQTRSFGAANPPLTFTLTAGSLLDGDMLSGEPATTAMAGSTGGSYRITQGTLAASPNYALTFISGILMVIPQSPTGPSPSILILAHYEPQTCVMVTLASGQIEYIGPPGAACGGGAP